MSDKIDLLLINCPREATSNAEQRLQDQRMPLGIMYISSFVKQAGFTTRIVDAEALCHGVGEIAALAAKYRPRIVGMNCHTLNRFTVYEIANTIRILLPDALLVLGGPHPSLVPHDTFMECRSINVVVRGEGEQTMVDLLKLKELSEMERIAGIVYRRGDKIHVTVPRARLKDLDTLPLPDISGLPIEKYFDYEEQYLPGLWKRAYLSASRGCAYACSFCSQSAFWGQRDTFRSARSILNEMEYYYDKFGLRRFYFYDDTITDWPELTEFCRLNNGGGFLWSCSTRIDKVDSRILETMASGGCREIAFGLESGAKRTLTAVQKTWELRRSPQQVGDCVEKCANLGIVPRAHFMIGFPHEEKGDITETVRFAVSLKGRALRDANFFVVKVYPGTVFHGTEAKDIAKRQGFSEQEMYSSWSVYDWHSTRNPKVAAKLRRFNDIPRISAHPILGNLALRQLVRNAYEIFFSDLTTEDVEEYLWQGVHWESSEDHEEAGVAPAQINDRALAF